MRNLFLVVLSLAIEIFSLPALADSASILAQAKAGNALRYQFAIDNNAEIRDTSDNKAFTIWWQPSSAAPAGVIVTLHGHDSFATDEFYLWQPYAQTKGYAILALQWWFGVGETMSDYYLPQQMYPIFASLLAEKGVKSGTVLFHGYSRGSANSYGVAALDTYSGNRYFNMVLSNAGGAAADFPPNQQVDAGAYGAQPFAGIQWTMYCGELDPDPAICSKMTDARDWVVKYGATFRLLIDDPVGNHGGFMTNSTNVNTAIAQFDPTSTSTSAMSDCMFNWAENSYSQFFPATGSPSATSAPYYYRYYPSTTTYLATSSTDNHVWAFGPITGNKLLDLGPMGAFVSPSACLK